MAWTKEKSKRYAELIEKKVFSGLTDDQNVELEALRPEFTQYEFERKLLKNTQDLPPEFSKAVDDHFWELI